jgi:hypothetical protein
MQLHTRMPGQPATHGRVLVGGVVVAYHMQLPARIGPGHELEEGQELLMAVPGLALVGDPPGGDLHAATSVVACRT